jgi:hypothetical protein
LLKFIVAVPSAGGQSRTVEDGWKCITLSAEQEGSMTREIFFDSANDAMACFIAAKFSVAKKT